MAVLTIPTKISELSWTIGEDPIKENSNGSIDAKGRPTSGLWSERLKQDEPQGMFADDHDGSGDVSHPAQEVTKTKGKETDERSTPMELFGPLDAIFHFNLDPCATAENAKCPKYFDIASDGLSLDWLCTTVFCNPPFSRGQVAKWIRKAADSTPAAQTVMLLKVDPSTKWFQLVWQFGDFIYFPARRFAFGPHGQVADFPICLVGFGYTTWDLELRSLERLLFGGRAIWIP